MNITAPWAAAAIAAAALQPDPSYATSAPVLDCAAGAACRITLTIEERPDGCHVMAPAGAVVLRREGEPARRPVSWEIATPGYRFTTCTTGMLSEACAIEIKRNVGLDGKRAFLQRHASGPQGYQWTSTGAHTLRESHPYAPTFIAHVVRESEPAVECKADLPAFGARASLP